MNKLKEIRVKNNLTQQELANKLGVTQRYIAFIENGDRTPSLENACKIAKGVMVWVRLRFRFGTKKFLRRKSVVQ